MAFNLQHYNESVWVEEVATGFKKHIEECIEISGYPVRTAFHGDDPDFRVGTFPAVLIQQLWEQFETERFVPSYVSEEDDLRVSLDKEKRTAVYEKPAQSFAQYFQLDFYAETPQEKYEMTRKWAGAHGRPDYFNMLVVDASGKDRAVPVHLIQSKNNDALAKDDNLFRDTKIYRVRVEIDEGTRYTIHVLEKIGLNANIIPGGGIV